MQKFFGLKLCKAGPAGGVIDVTIYQPIKHIVYT